MRHYFGPLVTMPTIITEPGQYLTRSGELVEITKVSAFHEFACAGTYAEAARRDDWHKSGRLYATLECANDIVGRP